MLTSLTVQVTQWWQLEERAHTKALMKKIPFHIQETTTINQGKSVTSSVFWVSLF